ncbi:hypothetical protein DMB92_07560 [Campylobacter sp. MIT 99-7217]|uniref:hypothetical protein n=1 Tax=Campylobacter sp. MIT 99-7217 TaxID=535091 RepID=UPI00115A7E84|nr:hypothetical protein [Campylobacter sp. MIT 99-7217]TQR30311.1 hypothetical protein DMB92_07560 [Campylobacter sp. MIT 99-7217]
MKIFVFALLIFGSILLAKENSHKFILKDMQDDFVLIDLKQENQINLDKQTEIFNTEDERKLNNERLKYDDTKRDLALIFAFKPNFNFSFKSYDVNASDFTEDIFENLVLKLDERKGFELLNKQTNILYQTKSNFCSLLECEQFILFESSNLLAYESSNQRMYEKRADFLLSIALLDFKDDTKREASQKANVDYKLIDLHTNKIIESKNLQITFYPTKESGEQNYMYILQDFAKILYETSLRSSRDLKL